MTGIILTAAVIGGLGAFFSWVLWLLAEMTKEPDED